MFGFEKPLRKRRSVVVWQDGYRRLSDYWSGVCIEARKMNCASSDPDARIQRLLLCVQSLEGRQQCRMDIEDPVLPLLHKFRGEQPHEAGKTD